MHSYASKACFFDAVASSDAVTDEQAGQRLATLFDRLQFTPAGRLLDLGCGSGVLLPLLSGCEGVSQLIEMDISCGMLREAKKHEAAGRVHFVCAAGEHLPLCDNSLDGIVCYCAFAHFEDKKAFLKEAFRVLRAGGELLVVHNGNSEQITRLHSELGGAVAEDHLPPVAESATWGREIGFQVMNQRESEGLYLLQVQKPA